MCNKVSYDSKREANTVLNSFHKNHRGGNTHKFRDKIPCRSYHCEVCGKWHLTSIFKYHEAKE